MISPISGAGAHGASWITTALRMISAASAAAAAPLAWMVQSGSPAFTLSPTLTRPSTPTAGSIASSAFARPAAQAQRGERDAHRVDLGDKAPPLARKGLLLRRLRKAPGLVHHPGVAALGGHDLAELRERRPRGDAGLEPRPCGRRVRRRAGEEQHLRARARR